MHDQVSYIHTKFLPVPIDVVGSDTSVAFLDPFTSIFTYITRFQSLTLFVEQRRGIGGAPRKFNLLVLSELKGNSIAES